jgi:predicted PurR-regulated permease PerM
VIQQIEGQFITPKIMGKIVGLSPVTVISSLLIGGTLAGIPGMMIAVPAAAAISVIIKEWENLK